MRYQININLFVKIHKFQVQTLSLILHLQEGSAPDHSPLGWHTLTLSPTST